MLSYFILLFSASLNLDILINFNLLVYIILNKKSPKGRQYIYSSLSFRIDWCCLLRIHRSNLSCFATAEYFCIIFLYFFLRIFFTRCLHIAITYFYIFLHVFILRRKKEYTFFNINLKRLEHPLRVHFILLSILFKTRNKR